MILAKDANEKKKKREREKYQKYIWSVKHM